MSSLFSFNIFSVTFLLLFSKRSGEAFTIFYLSISISAFNLTISSEYCLFLSFASLCSLSTSCLTSASINFLFLTIKIGSQIDSNLISSTACLILSLSSIFARSISSLYSVSLGFLFLDSKKI